MNNKHGKGLLHVETSINATYFARKIEDKLGLFNIEKYNVILKYSLLAKICKI